MFKARLFVKITFLVAILTVGTSIAVGIYIYSGYNNIIHHHELEKIKSEAYLRSVSLLSHIESLKQDTLYLASTPPIKGIFNSLATGFDKSGTSTLSQWKHRLEVIFTERIRVKPNYLQVRFIGNFDGGKEIIRVNRKGNLIFTTPPDSLQQKGKSKYFKDSIKLVPGELYISDVTLNREYGKIEIPHRPVIRVATPVYIDNKVVGIIIINMDFAKTLNDFVQMTPEYLTPFIVNEKGYYLAHLNPAMTFGADLGNDFNISYIYPFLINDLASDTRTAFVSSERSFHGSPRFIYIVKNLFDDQDPRRFFGLAFEISSDHLGVESQKLIERSLFVLIGFVIFGILLSLWFARKITNPLKLMIKASQDIAEGRRDIEIKENSGDEVGELARAFNKMHNKLLRNQKLLIGSQKKSAEASKMASLGLLSAGIAHEINNPLAIIKGKGQSILRMVDKGRIDEYRLKEAAELIVLTTDRIEKIIQGLRSFARDGASDPYKMTSIKKIINDSLLFCESKIRNDGIEVIQKVHTSGIELQCRETQISQVLVNLISNARTAIIDLKDKWIHIEVFEKDDVIFIKVTDSGAGIAEDKVDKVLDPFYTTGNIGHGMGLGLSISRGIIEDHDGKIYIDRECEHTRFVVELPKYHFELDREHHSDTVSKGVE